MLDETEIAVDPASALRLSGLSVFWVGFVELVTRDSGRIVCMAEDVKRNEDVGDAAEPLDAEPDSWTDGDE
jgi:hypothetical protein